MSSTSRLSTSLAIALLYFLPSVFASLRFFEFALTWENDAPDGVQRQMFKINGLFPGPTLEVEEGDDVVVHVTNLSPFNTTIHYHGIEQLGTPWSDGTPGLSQFQIQKGCHFTYKWKATQYGSFWYHAHSQSQMNDGLYGPIVIHPRAEREAPYTSITNDSRSLRAISIAERKRIPLVLSDWLHVTSMTEWLSSKKTGVADTCFDSILINGKGKVTCLSEQEQDLLITPVMEELLSAVPGSKLTDKSCLPPEVIAAFSPPGTPKPDFGAVPKSFFYGCQATEGSHEVITVVQNPADHETWVMLDIIGAFASELAQVSVDELTMYVVAADGHYIEPQAVQSIFVTNGERYTVLVKPETPKNYTIRVSGTAASQLLSSTATLDFRKVGQRQSSTPSEPFIDPVGNNVTSDVVFFDVDQTPPYPPSPVPSQADATFKMTMTEDAGAIYWAFNETTLSESTEDGRPLLLSPQPGREDNHTITVPSTHEWVDYIMFTPEGGPQHPVHIHGRHFYVLGRGTGNFTWNTIGEASKAMPDAFNLINPPLRDTFPTLSAPNSWLAVRRPSDNPGVWLMHCHIQSHLQGGMAMIIQDGVDSLPAMPLEYKYPHC